MEDEKIRLHFDHAVSGLAIGVAPALRLNQAPSEPLDHLTAFEIAGADKKFVAAQTKIENDTLLVWSDQVITPVAVRYAWSSNPEPTANLYNREGLPAPPFSTAEQ